MSIIEIPREVDRFVLYFDTSQRRINAYALATSLIGLSDAVRAANAAVNPGYHVEVVVEALEDGSFQAVVRTIYEKTRDLLSSEAVKAIVYGIIATHIYETVIKTDVPPVVTVGADVVTVEVGKEKIIVPRDVYEAKKQLERSERFSAAVGQIFHGAQSDDSVKGLGLKTNPDKSLPTLYVPRDSFVVFNSKGAEEGAVKSLSSLHLKYQGRFFRGGRESGSSIGVGCVFPLLCLTPTSMIVFLRMRSQLRQAMDYESPCGSFRSSCLIQASL